MKKPLILILILLMMTQLHARVPATGLWYPPNQNGHGIDLQKVGSIYTVIFYTYDEQGNPTWYQGVAGWQDSNSDLSLVGNFNYFNYDSTASPPTQLVGEVGEFIIQVDQPHSSCEGINSDHQIVFTWQINEQESTWCLVPTLAQSDVRQVDYTGQYYSGENDTGWGFSLDYQGAESSKTAVALVYYYDDTGQPRWSIGTDLSSDGMSTMNMNHVTGYCRSCEPTELQFVDAGELILELNIENNQRNGSANLDINYPVGSGGSWLRSNTPLIPLSEPEPGVMPLTNVIGQEQITGVSDVTIVPMTEGYPILKHRNLVIENGLITDINQHPNFASEFNGSLIEGRGLYLAPGMSEMHAHITVGGQTAAEQTGLLLIANGITTAMNTGNQFTNDVPQLADRFENGELIGPTLYVGQVAYGPNDNGPASLTVDSAASATQYANILNSGSYDFIKFYWQLSVQTIDQFIIESERLGLPIIGHLPLTQSMFRSLFLGQKLAVHIQEPYVTQMNSVRDESLLPAVADVFLENGAYLSPTLAVFESYVMISNNNVEIYNEYINREGNQYTPQTVKDAWQNYFNQPYIQVSDRENLLDLFDFYIVMTKALFDAGVPMLSGTDATGFPGVMAGYGVHEELRLLHQAGIPIADVFAITARNAGQFIEDTLNESVKFGTIEAGRRADFILTTENPLTSLETIKKPMGVMARGRFWSQVYLQDQLNQLDLSNQNKLLLNDHELPFCDHQHQYH